MANYSIIANSTFQPFTYQELALPLDRQEAYQEKLEEEYEKLSTQADVLEAMGSNDRDKASGAYGKYKAYSDALRKEADDLYRFGLNTESRQRLTDLRRKYNTDIVPIQNAWTKREQEANDQMKATLANPSLMFTRDARNSTLDDYLRNPTGGYGVISGANITAQMASMAGQLAKQVRSGRRENIDSYTYNYIEKYGLDENLIRNWRNSPTLTKMFEQVMQANGVTPEALEGSMNADSIISKSTNYAEMGMWNAMGEDRAQIRENYGARLAAQKAAELDNYWQKKQMDAYFAGGGVGSLGEFREEPTGIETKEGYVTNAPELLAGLKGGTNSWKKAYFGNTLGIVNPLKIYKEYQEELKKEYNKTPTLSYAQGRGVLKNTPNSEAAKKTILDKYKKYGVTDIISPAQYGLLEAMGYNENSDLSREMYSNAMTKLNNLAVRHTRYSTSMANYDHPDEWIRGGLISRDNENNLVGNIWEMPKKGESPSMITDLDDLKLYTAEDTKGGKVNDILYDPHYKGRLVVSLTNGKRFLMSPNVIDQQLGKEMEYWETRNADPRAITGRIKEYLNKYNFTRGNTSSNI